MTKLSTVIFIVFIIIIIIIIIIISNVGSKAVTRINLSITSSS